jgi:hypothetical protein
LLLLLAAAAAAAAGCCCLQVMCCWWALTGATAQLRCRLPTMTQQVGCRTRVLCSLSDLKAGWPCICSCLFATVRFVSMSGQSLSHSLSCLLHLATDTTGSSSASHSALVGMSPSRAPCAHISRD